MADVDCEICGNPIRVGTTECPFCNQPQTSSAPARKSVRFLTCNIKEGQPFVAEAEDRLRREIDRAQQSGARVLTVIHGYGASGTGGRIREATLTLIRAMEATRTIRGFVRGEDFGPWSSEGAELTRRFPALRDEHRDWGKENRGITLVVL